MLILQKDKSLWCSSGFPQQTALRFRQEEAKVRRDQVGYAALSNQAPLFM